MLHGNCNKCYNYGSLPSTCEDDKGNPVCSTCYKRYYSPTAKRDSKILRLLDEKKWRRFWKINNKN